MGIESRLEKLERALAEEGDAVADAVLGRLTDTELRALAGPAERWAGCSTELIEAVARGERDPEALADYEPPPLVLERLREVSTSREWRVLKGMI